jgi:hypothetical protein
VSNSARMSEEKVLCGTGRVMRLDVLKEESHFWKRAEMMEETDQKGVAGS